MRKNEIKTKFMMHELLISILCGVVFTGFLLAGCAHKTLESQNKTGMDNAANILSSALNDAGAGKTGDAVKTVQVGDLVGVRYCLTLENGEILRTNIREILDNSEITLSDKYIESITFNDLEVLAGKKDSFPGLHNAVIGMKKGETNKIVIPPEEGYGPRSGARIRSFSSVRRLPKKTSVSLKKFHELFKSAPVKGNLVHLVPYFYHRITEINEKEVALEAEIKDAFSLKSEIGDTRIFQEENNIAIALQPKQGADFVMGNEKGRIVSMDENSFTVDFNHPLAGKKLFLELTVDSVIKASSLKDWELSWHEDYDDGLAITKKTGKPVVLIFYEDGCPWCEKLFNETLKDPRIEYLENEFVWIKADGEKHPELMDSYKMDSYPSILLLDSKGKVIEKMTGFKFAPVLRDRLNTALQKIGKTHISALVEKNPVKKNNLKIRL
ncbi:MAG: FKBP-type peptidyl-prolyl cis-trans isomerase [Desulfobacteraceae bacterium]|jgi:FKBP-type peptidyl-prolyl cis-trans isomerase 2